jgi:hypothetical protein
VFRRPPETNAKIRIWAALILQPNHDMIPLQWVQHPIVMRLLKLTLTVRG